MRLLSSIVLLLVSSMVYAEVNTNASPAAIAQLDQTNQCSGCDLSDLNWISQLKSVDHSGAILNGANLSNNTLGNGFSKPVNLAGANLIGANLSGVQSSGDSVNFSQANLTKANLTGAALTNTNFSQAELQGAVFSGTDLTRANFYNAQDTNLDGARLCQTIMPDGSINNTGC